MKLYNNPDAGCSSRPAAASGDVKTPSVAVRLGMPYFVFFMDVIPPGCHGNLRPFYTSGKHRIPALTATVPEIWCPIRTGKGTGLRHHRHRSLRPHAGNGCYELLRQRSKKDQSYVCPNLTQEQLAHTQFPLGDFMKRPIPGVAEERLHQSHKPDSQDICFVPNLNLYRSRTAHPFL